MKKFLFLLLIIAASRDTYAQFVVGGTNFTDSTWILTYYANNIPYTVVVKVKDTSWFSIRAKNFKLDSFDSRKNDAPVTAANMGMLWTTSDSGWTKRTPLSSIPLSNSQVTTALGFTPTNPNGTTLQYIRGDGSKATFPTTVSSFTNDAGYTTATSSTAFTNKTGNISQWTNDVSYLTSINSTQVTTALGFTPYNATNPSSFITQAGARTAVSLTTTGTSGAASYNNSTGVLNVPNYTVFTFAPVPDTLSAARSFNTVYQQSTTKYVDVRPSFSISCSLSLTGGTTGTIFLEDSTSGVPWSTKGTFSASNTGTLTIGLNTVQISGGQLCAMIAPNSFWRLRTVNNVGTPTFTMTQGTKITY